jgi:PEGA domain
LRPGHYTIDFKLGGYRSETLDIDAKAGRYFPVDLKLQRIASEPATPWYDRPSSPAAGTIFGPPRAAAAVEAPKSGPDPGLRKELRQPPSVPRAGELARRGAALDLRVTPENASVYLDGEFLGTGAELGRLERGVAVTPGTHHLDVVAPGHAAKSLELSVEAGARQQVVVQLDQPSGSE